jgi:predicted dehydrogenase
MHTSSRRKFLKTTGLVASVASFPNILHAQNKGDKLRLAVIATGGKGAAHLNQIKGANDVVTCFADVDKNAFGGVLKEWPAAKSYQDYRQLFDKEMANFDAVMIATPDHHHFMPTVLAMQGKKHCYTQKPLTHTVWEARQLNQGVQQLKLATQMGNQGHSNDGNRKIYEYINSGALGDVTSIHCVSNRPIWPQGIERPAGEDPVPENLDWDLWLGPAAKRPFKGNRTYHDFNWRGWYDFGGGALADMACHTMDSIFMSMNPGYPTSVEVLEIHGHTSETFPKGSIIKWSYGPGKLPNGQARPAFDVFWYDGKLMLDGKEVDASDVLVSKVPAELLTMPDGQKITLKGSGNLYVGSKCGLLVNGDYGDRSRIVPVDKAKEIGQPPKMLERIGTGSELDHYNDWRVACVGEKPWDHPGSNFTYAAPFTETILLGNVALRVGKGKVLEWDALKMAFKNSDEANKHITKEYREGWGIKLV